MPPIGTLHVLRLLYFVAFASILVLSGCGGSPEPPAKVKPVGYASPEEEAQIKAMAASTKKIEAPKPEELNKKKKGVAKKG